MLQHTEHEFEYECEDKTACIAKLIILLAVGIILMLAAILAFAAGSPPGYAAARWDALHFKPAIEKAEDKQCLACHAEVLKPSVSAKSPAGVASDTALAWYQTLDVYSGNQDTFHRRHLVGEMAKNLMNLRCNTCHQGHDPRDEAPGTSATTQTNGYTLRKLVDPNTCLMCHGQFNYEVMGLPGPWAQHGETFGNNCMTCHEGIRTTRHNVNFLNAGAIEAAGRESSENCYGCHGGRAWYRIPFPYPRHAWEGMDKDVPDWAKSRPTESEPRFRLSNWAAPAVIPASVSQTPAAKPSSESAAKSSRFTAGKKTPSRSNRLTMKGK